MSFSTDDTLTKVDRDLDHLFHEIQGLKKVVERLVAVLDEQRKLVMTLVTVLQNSAGEP